ncbi:hypothetical protein [Streptomyces sp. NPDC059874]
MNLAELAQQLLAAAVAEFLGALAAAWAWRRLSRRLSRRRGDGQ